MPGQLSLFDERPAGPRRDAPGTRGFIRLAGRVVEYRFARSRRRTLGIVVDADGLSVRAPLRAAWREVEAFVREKERWIVAKLDERAAAPRPRVLRGGDGEVLPLFGALVKLAVRAGRALPSCANSASNAAGLTAPLAARACRRATVAARRCGSIGFSR